MDPARVVGLDVGGTFTDVLVRAGNGALMAYKFPAAERSALARIFADGTPTAEVLYSTTAAVNSLLAGDLPRVGLIVTRGFRDLLETARLPPRAGGADRGPLPPRLIALENVYELDARMNASGAEVAAPDEAAIARIAAQLAAADIDVVAVALLHSYLNPAHELACAERLSALLPSLTILLSSTVLPVAREYERSLVTALNAALVPVLRTHLDAFAALAGNTRPAWLMQAAGGLAATGSARLRPLGTALAGPAAAVVGMQWLAERSGYDNLITLDIGGTSTDVALVQAGYDNLTTAGQVAGFDVPVPMLDVLSIGAGGGSIAYASPDRRWHVGPQSAGAEPGPACYGRGGEQPTLTDAELLLGRLPPALLGGAIPLDRDRAQAVLAAFGATRGLDAIACARGIVDIAVNTMCGAVRRVIALRGVEPQRLTLFAMGGAGPLHGAELAALLGIGRVLVPPQPGLAAAWGVMVAAVREEFIAPVGVLVEALAAPRFAAARAALRRAAQDWLQDQALDAHNATFTEKLDLRYAGMTHDTTINCPENVAPDALLAATAELFHRHFATHTGRSWRDQEAVEVVNLRLVVAVARPAPSTTAVTTPVAGTSRPRCRRAVGFHGRPTMLDSLIVDRVTLTPGAVVDGPAVIEQFEATTVVPPDWHARVDDTGNLVLESAAGGAGRTHEL